MFGDSSFVSSIASVVPPVAGFHCFDVQNWKFVASFRNQHPVTRGDIILSRWLKTIRQSPPNMHRQIAFCDGASRRNGFVKVHFFVSEVEGEDLRKNWKVNCKILWRIASGKRIIKICALTIDRKISAVLCHPSFVLCVASVVSPMARFYSFNIQNRELTACLGNDNIVVAGNIELRQRLNAFRKRPPNVEWQISFADGTSGSHWFV